MMKDYKKERSLSTVAAILLFVVFAAGVFGVLLGGAEVYRSLAQRDAEVYDSRTCHQYLANKLRQAPKPDAVRIVPFGESDGLQIVQSVEGEPYVTWIYCHDGWLMELFCIADGEFSAEDGEKILPASGLSVTQQQDLLRIDITDENGQTLQLNHALRGWEETP